MDGDGWSHAALRLAQRGWPGTQPSDWVAETAGSEQFRSADLLAAMDRLGADGWELAAFRPGWGDQAPSFYFKIRTARLPEGDR